jgi:hypothetical protein
MKMPVVINSHMIEQISEIKSFGRKTCDKGTGDAHGEIS